MDTTREYQTDIMQTAKDRWSPRGFDPDYRISEEEIHRLIEAAGTAPSAFNEQPWRFIVGKKPGKLYQKVFDALVPKNQNWAKNASALIVILAHQYFSVDGRENAFAEFDVGSSWGLMAQQAIVDNLHTHAMAGFSGKKIREAFDLPKEFKPIAIIAVGKYKGPEVLEEALRPMEKPASRRKFQESILYKD